MTPKTQKHKPTDHYFELVKTFPLKPLRTDSDYDKAGKVLARLVVRP